MNFDSFFAELSLQFPQIVSVLDSDDENHYKMERFANHIIEQIKQKNVTEIKKCFDFIETRLESVTPEIENALNVSFCETLMWYDDHKKGIEMKKIMSEKLLLFYSEYKKYYDSLG